MHIELNRVVLVGVMLSLAITIGFIVYLIQPVDEGPVKIAVVDSGCALKQDQRVIEYVSFVNTSYGYDSDEIPEYDVLNHGRYVCQQILDHTEKSIILSVKVAAYNGALTYEGLFAGIEWAVEQDVDIINLSLGAPGVINEDLIEKMEGFAEQAVIIAASGNTGSDNLNTFGLGDWPANLPFIIGVGAYDGNDTTPAYYTARGKTYTGNYITEFSAFGSIDNKVGTSFSAPLITAQVATLMELEGTDLTISEIRSSMAYSSSRWPNFSPILGWGLPDGSLYQPGVAVFGSDWVDEKPRFLDETWSQVWLISSPSQIESELFSITGNGSNFVELGIDTQYWGSNIILSFSGFNKSGTYEVEFSYPGSNTIKYSFNVMGKSKGRILYDHRTTINSYGHDYGEYLNSELYLRDQGYIVEHQLIQEPKDLSSYDMVIAPRFFQREYAITGYLSRDIPPYLLQEYIDYTYNGGTFVPLLDVDKKIRINDINVFLDVFDVYVIDDGIHNDYNPISIQNFSTPIMSGIVNFDFEGVGIGHNSANYSDLGWTKKIIDNIVYKQIYYLSIGVMGSYGNGTLIVLGSSYALRNQSFTDVNGLHFDRFLSNLLDR